MIIGCPKDKSEDEPTIKLTLSQREMDYITGVVGMHCSPHSMRHLYDQLLEAGGRAEPSSASLFIRGRSSSPNQLLDK